MLKIKIKNLIIVLMSVAVMFSIISCNSTNNTKDDKKPILVDANGFVYDNDSPYKIDDVIKSDSIFDTNSLFNTIPEIETVNLHSVEKGINIFKFKSIPYGKKDKTKDYTQVYSAIGYPDETLYPMPSNGYPSVILLHGGGGYIYSSWIKYWNDKGYVAIAIDMFGNGLGVSSGKLVKSSNQYGGPSEKDGPIFDEVDDYENSWVYHCVVNVIYANNILRNDEKVNKNQIGLTGISWGSVITEIVSGVDKRFNAFAPVYGSGYLFLDSKWNRGTLGGVNYEKWIEYFDPSSYLPYSTKPMLFVSGIDDSCFSVTNRARSYKLAKGKTFYSQRDNLGHGHFWSQTEEVFAFMEHILRGQNTLSSINGVTKQGNLLTLNFESDKSNFDTVTCLYSNSNEKDSHEWTFFAQGVDENNGKYTFTVDDKVNAYCFVTYNSENKVYQSTEIYVNTDFPIADTTVPFNYSEESEYKLDNENDYIMTDLMWDVKAIEQIKPEITDLQINAKKGISVYKMKSAPYTDKVATKDYTEVYFALGIPDKYTNPMPSGGYPAIVLVHGGAGQIYVDWVDYWTSKGYVAIAVDMFGNGLNANLQKCSNPMGGPSEKDGSNYDSTISEEKLKNSWVYHSVYNVMLANNILISKEYVNKNQIGITGISWGSVITEIVSGVDKRFNAFAPVYGSGYLYDDTFWTDQASKMSSYYGNAFGKDDKGGEDNWRKYYDPSSYIKYSTKPMLFVSGVGDRCFAVENRVKTYSLASGKVFYSQRYNFEHGDFWKDTNEIYYFMEDVLRNKKVLPTINGIKSENDTVYLDCEEIADYASVYFVYTTSTDEDSHKWQWNSVEVEKVNGEYSYQIDSEIKAYLFEIVYSQTENNLESHISTEIVLTK